MIRSSAVAVIADRTAYNVWYSYRTVVWNIRGRHEYLLVYSFELKSAFDVSFLVDRCVLWLNDTSYGKMSEEVNRRCCRRNTIVQLLAHYADP